MIATLELPQSVLAENLAPAASLEGVSKNYGDVVALRNVNFAVRPGEVVALLGPNGAGKTTAVKLLLGLMPPNAGKVRVRARSRDLASPRTYRPVRQLLPKTSAGKGSRRSCRPGEVRRSQVWGPLGRTEAARAVCAGHLRQSRPASSR